MSQTYLGGYPSGAETGQRLRREVERPDEGRGAPVGGALLLPARAGDVAGCGAEGGQGGSHGDGLRGAGPLVAAEREGYQFVVLRRRHE